MSRNFATAHAAAKIVIGVDEVGRGPLAGPVVAAACLFKTTYKNPEIKDSKQLSSKKRDYLSEVIKEKALDWAIVAVPASMISRINIREAAKLAMSLAVNQLPKADLVLVDGNMPIQTGLPQITVVGGDAKHLEIAAASILAKVWRDKLMQLYDEIYPGYNLSQHAGYPTASHKLAIKELGPSSIHRLTFRGVKEYVASSFNQTSPLENQLSVVQD